MADETKKGDIVSKEVVHEPLLDTHTTTSGIPEHEVLLSEHSTPEPVPMQQTVVIPPAIPKTPPPAPQPVAPPAPTNPVVTPVPQTPVVDTTSPPPAATPNAPSLPTTPQGPFSGDITKILKAIKLPERRVEPAVVSLRAPGEPKNVVSVDISGVKIISETVVPATPADAPPVLKTEVPPAPKTGLPPSKAVPDTAPQEKTVPGESAAMPGTMGNVTKKKAAPGGIAESWIVTPLRTLREDLQHVIKDRKISIVRAVALEEDKKKEVRALSSQEIASKRRRRQHSFAFIFASIVLLFLGAAALVGVYTIQNQRAPAIVIGDISSLIFSEMSVEFPIKDQSSGDLKRVISQSQFAAQATLGSITRIIPTLSPREGESGPRIATAAEFLYALDTHVPDELVRALGDTFFFGIHTVDKNVPIFVIPVVSYDHAFSGMLAWENSMSSDLSPIFPFVSVMKADVNGLPTTRTFEDIVMRNYDVRALKDDGGTIQLYYSFPTPNLLIVAESPYTFTEVLSRLQAERKL